MTQMKTKVTASGVLYIPKPIRECFGRDMEILTGVKAAIFFPELTSYEDVLKSLDVIRADLQCRILFRDKTNETGMQKQT